MQPRKCITAEKYNLKNRQPKKWFGSLTRGGRLREALIIGIWLQYCNCVLHRCKMHMEVRLYLILLLINPNKEKRFWS